MSTPELSVNSKNEQLFKQCNDLAFAWGKPLNKGLLKQTPADFIVEEVLGFEPDGNGEHLMLWIEKQQVTTLDVQSILAKAFNVPALKVAYCGMKDKQAITRQWFSVQTSVHYDVNNLPALPPTVTVLKAEKNSRKLRIGSHRGNRFKIRVAEIDLQINELEEKLKLITEHGVPNYFGPQRFGHGCNTLLQALAWFSNAPTKISRSRRGLLLSAARAFLFNQHLSQRVAEGVWNKAIDGDVMSLSGSASTFNASRASTQELEERLKSFDIHPSGPMWGAGELSSSGLSRSMEQSLSEHFKTLCVGLEAQGLKQERRPLRLQVEQLQHNYCDSDLVLEFTLCRGGYATTVIRELLQT